MAKKKPTGIRLAVRPFIATACAGGATVAGFIVMLDGEGVIRALGLYAIASGIAFASQIYDAWPSAKPAKKAPKQPVPFTPPVKETL